MIVFGTAMTDPEAYRRRAQPGVQRSVEDGSEVYALAAVGAIGRGYNLLLDAAAAHEDLEALVLVHQDAELVDPALCAKVRDVIADPGVGIAGPLGASDVRTIAWWEGTVRAGDVTHRYTAHGGGDVPAFAWTSPAPAPADVDVLDGSVLVLSPWAVRTLRFDEGLHLGHGFDLDFCRRVTAAGRRVRCIDVSVVLHRPLELVGELDLWVEAHVRAAEHTAQAADDTADEEAWKARARRAEAEREAARTIAYSKASELEARTLPLERELAALADTPSWRLTAPLRRANAARARRRSR